MNQDYKYVEKGYLGIFLNKQENFNKVLSHLKEDEFEFLYFHEECIQIIDDESFYNIQDHAYKVEYNGKYDGDMRKLIEFCNDNNIEINIITAYDDDSYPQGFSYYSNCNEKNMENEINKIIQNKKIPSSDKPKEILNLIRKFGIIN
jgi:hypothetical protein